MHGGHGFDSQGMHECIGCNWENKCLPYAFEGSIYYQQVRHYNHNFYLILKKKSE